MSYDHDAIRKAYSNVTVIDDGTGIFDKDGNVVTVEQSKIDEARIELNKLNYRDQRVIGQTTPYAPTGDQLDMIYKDLLAGTFTTSGTWATHVKSVKDANPKPS